MSTKARKRTLITSRHRKGRQLVSIAEAAVNAAGLDDDGAQQVNERGDEFKAGVIQLLQRLARPVEAGYELARQIIGEDFISPEEVATARGLTYSNEQLQQFASTLPSQDVLEWCAARGYMLTAGPPSPLSLIAVRELDPRYFYTKSGGWYAEGHQKFAQEEHVGPVWLMLRKDAVPDSLDKAWDNQLRLLTKVEQVPNAAEAVWGFTTYMAIRSKYLVPNVYVRTCSVAADGSHVDVGHFDACGLSVSYYWGDSRDCGLGVASVRKSEP